MDPRRSAGGFVSGVLQGGLLIHHVGGWGELHAGTGAFLVLCALNAAVGLWAISLVVGSRMREPVWWRLRDLADGRMPQDRPPETIEEYEAAQLDLELMDDGHDNGEAFGTDGTGANAR